MKPKTMYKDLRIAEEVYVELIVRLTDGKFESKLTVPLDATEKERDDFIKSWLALMDAGIKVGQSAKAKDLKHGD